ncbi:MAG: MiaB/RimO family radical SAM methylthiotransferase [Candidatus Muirbacterium halophilum]|nr:MiaB/RimO family radical SAM methylthiotransferase [Candidatus Muirbacterium halophilum]MCK9476432.1 MiaB/RimO family radical SAM methylthiotransferase [Candidatus Muirbacterium halophilum]
MSLSFNIFTFGCKVNQYDSQLIRSNLIEKGNFIKTDNPDFIIVNMCSLTQNAVRKTRLLLNRVKRENPDSKIILTGCIEDDVVLDVDYKVHVREKEKIYDIFDISIPLEYLKDFSGHSRAFVMIQEGCKNFCTYCIVPFMRNIMYSKPVEVFKKEINLLAKSGFKEIVLTGTHINRYNYKENTLKDLVDIIEKQPGIERFRISSIEPNEIDDDFIKIISESKKFCSHLHLSIQSASNLILEKMERNYSIKKVVDIINKLKNIPNFEWSSDFIVGFPGELEQDFNETVEFIKKYKPVFLHVFPFSKRKGTKAFLMKENLTNKDKKNKAALLREAQKEVQKSVWQKYIGKTLNILVEKEEDGYYTGYSENYIKVFIKNDKIIKKENIYFVKIIDIKNDGLIGSRI